jgi:hypothetical protein
VTFWPAGGFVTMRFTWEPSPAPVVLRYENAPPQPATPPEPAAPERIYNWKDIIEVSRAHGGPTTEQHLRWLAKKRGCPIYAADCGGTTGTVMVRDKKDFIRWLDDRFVHMSLRHLSEPRAKKVTKRKRRKPAPEARPT